MKAPTFVLLTSSIPLANPAHSFSCIEYDGERERIRVESVNSLARIMGRLGSEVELCRMIREELIPMTERHIGSITKFTKCKQVGPKAEEEIQSKKDYIEKMERDAAEFCDGPND